MILTAISENTNIFQFIASIFESLKSTHDHIVEYFQSIASYFNLLGNIKNVLTDTFGWFINDSNVRSVAMLYTVLVMFIITGIVFIFIDFIRDVL